MSAIQARSLRLVVLTCEALLFEGDAAWAEAPLSDGIIGIWPDHLPLVGELGVGTLRYAAGGQVTEIAVDGGVLHVSPDECAVLLSARAQAPATDSEPMFVALESALMEMLRDEETADSGGEQQDDGELGSVAADRSGE